MKRGVQWPVGVLAVLVVSTVGQIWYAVVANRDQAFAVEGDYYTKAIHWDEELTQRQASALLGWRIVPRLQLGRGPVEGALSIELRDSTGTPITGAEVEVLAMHNARASRQLSATLAEVGRGTYRARLAAQRPGEWERRFSVKRGAQRFVVSKRLDAMLN